jgi:LuxR family maltose regulon positive regulatory protein
LTVVRGLRGYGKTTAVAAWLAHQSPEQVTVVWVSAGPTAEDVQSFEDRLSLSLRNDLVPPRDTTRNEGTGGLPELRAALLAAPHDRKFVLVVDNFEHVRDEQLLAELTRLVERLRHFHVVVCCLGHHPIESVATGKVDINVVEPGELLFTVEETADLAQAMGLNLEPAAAERLHDAVGGFISMLRVALEGGEDFTVRAAAVDEYVNAHLLSGVEEESVLRLLRRFSLAEALSWPLFRDLCRVPDPGQALEDLEMTGLVRRSIDGEEVLLTMPGRVRQVLRDQFTTSSPEQARDFHRRLASWYAGHDGERHLALAFRHSVAGGDWALMDQLWSESLMTIHRQDAALMLEGLVSLPTDVLAARPSMQVLRDTMRIAITDTDVDGRRATLRAYAESCARLIDEHVETRSLNELLVVATGYLIELRLLGHFEESNAFGDRVNARVTAMGRTEPADKVRLAWFHLHRGVTSTLLGDEVSAIRSYKRAWECCTGAGSAADFLRAASSANLALTYALAGDAAPAREWLERHRSFDRSKWNGDKVIGIAGHVAAGLLALDRLDDAIVRSELAQLGDGSVAVEFWPFIAYLSAQHALHSGLCEEALSRLDQLQAAHDEGRQASKRAAAALMGRVRCDLLIACGRGEAAKQVLRDRITKKPWNWVPAVRIRVLGDHPELPGQAEQLAWDSSTSTRDRLEILLLGAVEALRSADLAGAGRLVNQALDLYTETGLVRPFATIPAAERARLLSLANRELEPDDAAVLARQAPVYPETLAFVDLSGHEQKVLEALSRTASRQEIADELFVSVNTVKTQLSSIYHKLGGATRAETLAKARQHELLPPDEPR